METQAALDILTIAIVALSVSTVSCALAWIKARERAIRAESRMTSLAGPTEQRLDRIEQSIEAMAVDVERIAEAERFASRLLADRHGNTAPAPRDP